LVPDGIEILPSDEFQIFPVKVRIGSKGQLTIHVPVNIYRAMGVTDGDILEVAIRKIDAAQCFGKYGWVPGRGTRYRRLVIRCPRCGEEGTLTINRRYNWRCLYVDHGGRVRHYLSKKKYGEIYEKMLPLLEGRAEQA